MKLKCNCQIQMKKPERQSKMKKPLELMQCRLLGDLSLIF